MIHRSLAIHSLLCTLFLTMSGSAHAVIFSLQPSIQTIQQGIPGTAIPGQQQQQGSRHNNNNLKHRTTIIPSPPTVIPGQQQSQEVTEGIIVHGIIDSLIFTPSATWIASGNWTIGVNNGNACVSYSKYDLV